MGSAERCHQKPFQQRFLLGGVIRNRSSKSVGWKVSSETVPATVVAGGEESSETVAVRVLLGGVIRNPSSKGFCLEVSSETVPARVSAGRGHQKPFQQKFLLGGVIRNRSSNGLC